ncbi:translational activator of GCN4 [Malassezia cuniculi]|uniref:Translational activator of GCN4 n=1 Tax=Malassezia cuniculi TaxID=948313 RepID=A0AAF0EV76_9BASI|nr:translational activator of GCN4 [Malassezia cuniculi]
MNLASRYNIKVSSLVEYTHSGIFLISIILVTPEEPDPVLIRFNDAESPYNSDDDMAPRRPRAAASESEVDWDTFFEQITSILRGSRTGPKDSFFQHGVPAIAGDETVEPEQLSELVQLVFSTSGVPTRRATLVKALDAVDLLIVADKSGSTVLKDLYDAVKKASDGLIGAKGNLNVGRKTLYYVYTWLVFILKHVLRTQTELIPVAALLSAVSIAYVQLLITSKGPDAVLHGVHRSTWRVIRNAHESIPKVLDILLGLGTQEAVAFVGLVVDVCLHLRVGKETEKGAADGVGFSYVTAVKDKILQEYTTKIVASKKPVHESVIFSLELFFRRVVDAQSLEAHVLPTLDKMMLRSPEVVLPVAAALLSFGNGDAVIGHVCKSFVPSAQSANAATRAGAVTLAKAIKHAQISTDAANNVINTVCSTVKPGESRSVEQSETVYTVLENLPLEGTRVEETLAAMIQKENQPVPLAAAVKALFERTKSSGPMPKPAVDALLAKLETPKAPLRGAVLGVLDDYCMKDRSDHIAAILSSLVPALKTILKNGAGSALTSTESATDAAIATSLLLSHGEKTVIDDDVILSALFKTTPKPSFLLNERVVRRVAEGTKPEAHAEALLGAITSGIKIDEGARPLVAAVMYEDLRIAKGVSSATAAIRQVALTDAKLAAWLAVQVMERVGESPPSGAALRAFLREAVACVPDREAKLDSLATLVLHAHSPALDDVEGDMFVSMCRASHDGVNIDPHDAIAERRDVYNEALANDTGAALSTICFIAPDVMLASVCSGIVAGLALDEITKVSDDDVAVWRTPDDVLHVDPLQTDTKTSRRGKGSGSIDQWEAEVRASIASKGGARLTREQQQAVDAQFAAERATRARVQEVKTRISTALGRVVAITNVPTALGHFVLPLTQRVWATLGVPRLEELDVSGEQALRGISKSWSGSANVGTSVLQAMLRTHKKDDSVEPLEELELRILYRLRFMIDRETVDSTSMCFLAPWLAEVVRHSVLRGDEEADDKAVERMQLTVDFLAACASGAAQEDFPRATVLGVLLDICRRFPMLAQDAISALRAYGDAISRSKEASEKSVIDLLLAAVYAEERQQREGALQCLVSLDVTEYEFLAPVWLAVHDDDGECARLAQCVWEDNGLDVPEVFAGELVPLLGHELPYVRETAARAIASATELHPEAAAAVRDALLEMYRTNNIDLSPQYDEFGMVIDSTLNREDPWRTRAAVADALGRIASFVGDADLGPLFDFFLENDAALADRDENARRAMIDAASAAVDAHGGQVKTVIDRLESCLGSNDVLTEAAVVLLGRAARHLEGSDAHIRRVVQRLLDALHTPSEAVQVAVAACLPPLMTAATVSPDVNDIVDGLFSELLYGEKYASRRGAAYGLAGVVKGRGVSAIRELRIMPRLADAIGDSQPTARQGALFAYETLAGTLRLLFEPYVSGILSHLLVCFGDNNTDVREATQDASRVLMQSISGQCLKTVLPSLLQGLEEKQWRTKKGAIELLGAMAYCAPRQLSAALPTVIPRLSDVLTDSHTQVRNAANRSLKEFGEVIQNPEIRSLVPVLLKALVDPNSKTSAALKALLSTKFVHYIDAPSLALIAPIIERGLRERQVLAQKHATQIVGNLASLTDSRDFVPYLDKYTPLIRVVLVSPVPDARGVAAKALGTLVERLGEIHFIDLIPSLLRVLQTDSSGVDRHGAAQGLAEVLAGLGIERMELLLPSIIENTHSKAAYVREGYLALLIYLPATFGSRFVPHLGRIVPSIVASIADEVESVREASLRAGRMIISNYSTQAVELLLPQLEPKMFSDSWRLRLSALQLVGDLLFRLSGISGKAEIEEDGTEESAAVNSSVQKALISALGADRRNRILAALYILRQDPNIPVRQSAIQTWKALVHNTPRTAREILPVMLDLLVGALASTGEEQREMAGRTMGELVRKLGEKILHEAIPLLAARGSAAPEPETRAGVAHAVYEVIANATRVQLEDHEDALIEIVRRALVDPSSTVRTAAARAFDAVQTHLGGRATDTTIPTLLASLDGNDASAETALAALREIVRARSDVVYPVLVHSLAAVPISDRHAEALAVLAPVSGAAFAQSVDTVLSACAKTILSGTSSEALDRAVETTMANVRADSLHIVMVLLLGWMASRESPERRALACDFFVRFCRVRGDVNVEEYTIDFVRMLITLYEEDDERVNAAAMEALEACVSAQPKDSYGALVVPLRRAIEGAHGPIPGLCRPRGAKSIVPVFLHGLMHGNAEQKEQGVLGFADIVEHSTPDAIKPFVTAMVGPLIRLCGDRHVPPVKTAIILALDTMVERIPQLVRPFYPQLQRSFQKAVSEPTSANVRTRAGVALGHLMALQQRVEPVVLELVSGIEASLNGATVPVIGGAPGAEVDVGDAQALALAQVLQRVSTDKLSESTRGAVAGVVSATITAAEEPKDSVKRGVAEVAASLLLHGTAEIGPVLDRAVLLSEPIDVQFAAMVVGAAVEIAPAEFYSYAQPVQVAQLVMQWTTDAPSVARPAREAREALARVAPWADDSAVQNAL